MPPRRCFRAFALAFGAASLSGCGPTEYIAQVSSRAAAALAEAQRNGADRTAPYEYAKAVEYYRQAREDGSRSQFQTAIEWGRRSEDCARKASARARQPVPPVDQSTASLTCGTP